jgi:hypothetical protein
MLIISNIWRELVLDQKTHGFSLGRWAQHDKEGICSETLQP